MFSIKERQIGEVTILHLSGRITLGEGSSRLRKAIEELGAQRRRRVILDMGDISYIDSSGFGELVAAYTRAHGGKLSMMRVHGKPRDGEPRRYEIVQSETKAREDQLTSPKGDPVTALRFDGDISSTSKDAVLGSYQALSQRRRPSLFCWTLRRWTTSTLAGSRW
jgi:anti-sigma B factor antagonist